jgi:predicted metalloprotease with PDZ domain/catechol 2,3-dioxygenase-like lactoylglutathione lyase family enzyme
MSWLLIGVFAAAAAAQSVETLPQPGAGAQPAAAGRVAPIQMATPQGATPTTAVAPAASGARRPALVSPSSAPEPVRPKYSTPVAHEVSFPAPALHVANIVSAVPTDGQSSVELMMSRWTPGFYRIENYASDVQDLIAALPTGQRLAIEKTTPNRWRVETQGEPVVLVSYRLTCERGSVSRNYVGEDFAVICPGSTFLTPVGQLDRPHLVHLHMPDGWTRSATGLPVAPDSFAHHYVAKDYDTLVDSPIAVGKLTFHSFTVEGVPHHLVDIGTAEDLANWNGPQAARDLVKMVQETHNFWGGLPFKEYFFLNKVTRTGGGGLEHLNSTLIHTRPPRRRSSETNLDWLQFVAHEYFHAFNVKRLRPIELGPFDYENARRTSGLWVAEGLTNYFNSLLVARAGLCTQQAYLDEISGHISRLQGSPGRLAQSLAASSLDTWTGDGFGGGRGRDTSISYYTKGPVVGFLLDAKIRRATDNKKSLDDAMRLAYARYAGEVGYTEQQFLDTMAEVAGTDLKEFFDKVLFSTEELDYSEALDWFGLRFAASEDASQPSWRIEVLPDASDAQKARLETYLSPSRVPSPEVTAAAPAAGVMQAPAGPVGIVPLTVSPQGTAPAGPTTPAGPAQAAAPAQGGMPERAAEQGAAPVAPLAQPAPLVEGIGGVFIYSNDPARLAAWYEKHLGFTSERDPQMGAFIFSFKRGGGGAAAAEPATIWAILPSSEPRAAVPPRYAINYRVPDMDRMLQHLRDSGVETEKTEDHPDAGRFAWVRDADGNRVELYERPKRP